MEANIKIPGPGMSQGFSSDELLSMGQGRLTDPSAYMNSLYLSGGRDRFVAEVDILCDLGILKRCPETFDIYLTTRGFNSDISSEILS